MLYHFSDFAGYRPGEADKTLRVACGAEGKPRYATNRPNKVNCPACKAAMDATGGTMPAPCPPAPKVDAHTSDMPPTAAPAAEVQP